MKHKLYLFKLSMFLQLSCFAQGYGEWEKIYNNNDTYVSVSFRENVDACKGGRPHKFRFNIEGTLSNGKKTVYIGIKYVNCSGVEKIEIKSLDIGSDGGARGINESIDFILTGDISKRKVIASQTQQEVITQLGLNEENENFLIEIHAYQRTIIENQSIIISHIKNIPLEDVVKQMEKSIATNRDFVKAKAKKNITTIK